MIYFNRFCNLYFCNHLILLMKKQVICLCIVRPNAPPGTKRTDDDIDCLLEAVII